VLPYVQVLGSGTGEASNDVQSLLKTLQKCLAFEKEARARFDDATTTNTADGVTSDGEGGPDGDNKVPVQNNCCIKEQFCYQVLLACSV
jgi:hypothetical protein